MVYVEEFAGSRSMGRPRKSLINTPDECCRKRGLGIRQTRRTVHERSEWRGFLIKGECKGCSQGDEPSTLKRCHSSGLPGL